MHHMLGIYNKVAATGAHNFQAARIPLPTNLNLRKWAEVAEGYHDAEVVDLLTYGFPTSFTGGQLDTAHDNHASAKQYPEHIDHYTTTEVKEGALLGPFSRPPFQPWCQRNALLTRPKKDSEQRRVILDLSWPHPPLHSVNGGTPKDLYLGQPHKLTLPTPHDLCQLMKQAGRGCYMFATDVARAYRQLPLDPLDWPLTGFQTRQGYYTDISLPFGLRWAAHCCARVTNLVTHALQQQGVSSLVYIDDFVGLTRSKQAAEHQFGQLQDLLQDLGLQEAKHKATSPTQRITWLGLEFDSRNMTLSIPPAKLQDILTLVQQWQHKSTASITDLRSLLGKLLHVAQCSSPARLFLNRMLATLRSCPPRGSTRLSTEFKKDLAWFAQYLPTTNGVYIIHEDPRPVQHVYVDSSSQGAGAIFNKEAYHTLFPLSVLRQQRSICHLEALNAVVALKVWAERLTEQRVVLHSDSATAVAIMQAGRGRDPFLQACAREVWLIAARHNITLTVEHIPGEQLIESADALSRFHLGPSYKRRVQQLVQAGVSIIHPSEAHFTLSDSL